MSDRCHPGNELWFPGRLPGSFEIGCGGVAVLGGEDGRDWSQRYKANLEKLASGDLVQVVEVVRDLAGREASRGLSAGEKRMLAKARYLSRTLRPLIANSRPDSFGSILPVRAVL